MDSKNSPRRRQSSISRHSHGRESILCTLDTTAFRPMLVTNFGDYTLAYLTSTSRENFLALWGPEAQIAVTTELIVDDARVGLFIYIPPQTYQILVHSVLQKSVQWECSCT